MSFDLVTLIAKCLVVARGIHHHLSQIASHFFVAEPRCVGVNPLFLCSVSIGVVLYLFNIIWQFILLFIYYFNICKLPLLIRQVNIPISLSDHPDSNFTLKIAFLITFWWRRSTSRLHWSEIHGFVGGQRWAVKEVFHLFWC